MTNCKGKQWQVHLKINQLVDPENDKMFTQAWDRKNPSSGASDCIQKLKITSAYRI